MILKFTGIHSLILVLIVSRCSGDRDVILESEYAESDRAAVARRQTVGGTVNGQTEAILAEDELAWIVMIFDVTLVMVDTTEDESEVDRTVFPRCFGILVTAADVLTTCRCVSRRDDNSKADTSNYMMVKPKTSLVWWDDDYKAMIQKRPHEHCSQCGSQSYNDVALLTIEVVNTIHGIVETIPWSLLRPPMEDENMTWTEMYGDCHIFRLLKGVNTPALGSLELELRNFSTWDLTIPRNVLGTVPVFGTSYQENLTSLRESRFPGSPLMCRRKHGYVPVGIFLGGFCLNSSVHSLNDTCRKKLGNCEDCVLNPEQTTDFEYCPPQHYLEIALRFDSAFRGWIDDHTIEPTKQRLRKNKPVRPSNFHPILPLSYVVHVLIVFTRLVL